MQILPLIIAILISAAAGYWVYRADKKREVPYPWLTSGLRGIVILMALLLLLTSTITITKHETQKPVVLFLQDNSNSIAHALGKDTAAYRKSAEELTEKLSDKYRVVKWGFGSDVQQDSLFQYKQAATDISEALSKAQEFYSTQNLGAVILSSDGRFNWGSNPVYQQLSLNSAVYTVGLGDSAIQKDLRITQVYANKTVSLNSHFEIRADIIASLCRGYNNNIQLSEAGASLSGNSINITSDRYDRSVSFMVKANTTGLHHYVISVPVAEGEQNTANNRKDIFLEVVDEKKNILIAAASPHPDVNAIRDALAGVESYKVTVRMMDDLPPSLDEYSAVVLHQLPLFGGSFADMLQSSKKPIWYILGAQTNAGVLSRLTKPASINTTPGMTREITAAFDPAFNTFILPQSLQSVLEKMPPFNVPNGSIQAAPGAGILFKQRGNNPAESSPLWILQQGNIPNALLAGEGIWRWRLYEYKYFGKHDVVDECIRQTVSFLASNNNGKPFHVALPKYIWSDQEAISMNAYLLNANKEQVNTADVQLTITDSSGRKQNFSFEKAGSAYRLNIGVWAGGSYNYTAQTNFNGKAYSVSGNFFVETQPLELMETGADYGLLYSLAKKYNGSFVPASNISYLYDSISKNNNIKPILQTNTDTVPLVDWKWYFFLLLVFAVTEWLLRKYWLAQ